MSTQHAPGPWHVGPGNASYPRHVGTTDDAVVCAIFEMGEDFNNDETTPIANANALLIAAAPEMFNLLIEAYELMPLGTAKRAAWIRRTMTVIAKAVQS